MSFLLIFVALAAAGCEKGRSSLNARAALAERSAEAFVWEELTAKAGFPPSYNFPVHVTGDGRFMALHPEGTWFSRDGAVWTREALPWSGMNAAYLKYVQHDGASWAFGKLEGNYERFTIEPVVQRTSDYLSWETVGRSATLPHVVFYAAASFKGSLWILGGYDQRGQETAEVWRSTDGLNWQRVLDKAPWSARASASAVVFRGRLYLIGGGRIDGANANDVWSTSDGKEWKLETARITEDEAAGTPIVYKDRLWLVGANRTGSFSRAVIVSEDGRTWRTESAPWPARGGVAVWTNGEQLFMTGGKFSQVVRGETVFTYYGDVWRLRPASSDD